MNGNGKTWKFSLIWGLKYFMSSFVSHLFTIHTSLTLTQLITVMLLLQFLGQLDHETSGRPSSTTRRFLRPAGSQVCQAIGQKERQEIRVTHSLIPIWIETAFGLIWLVVISFQTINVNKNKKFVKRELVFSYCNFFCIFCRWQGVLCLVGRRRWNHSNKLHLLQSLQVNRFLFILHINNY